MDNPIFHNSKQAITCKTILKNLVENFAYTVQNLHLSLRLPLPLQKSQISSNILRLFQDQVHFEESSSPECDHQLKNIQEDCHNLLKPDILDFEIKAGLCGSNTENQEGEGSQPSVSSNQTGLKKQVRFSQSISQNNLLEQNKVYEQSKKMVKSSNNPFQNMNEDLNETNFNKSESDHIKRQFFVEFQSQSLSKAIIKIENEQCQNSFDIEQYQVSEYQQNKSEEQYVQNTALWKRNFRKRKQVKQQKYYYQTKKSYRSYTQEQKKFALMKAQNLGLDEASKLYNIPKKNIVRWIKKAEENNLCRGRKPINPFMQMELTNWIKNNIKQEIYVTQSDIRFKARELSGEMSFKASKGWLQKYFKRNKEIGGQLSKLLSSKRLQKRW